MNMSEDLWNTVLNIASMFFSCFVSYKVYGDMFKPKVIMNLDSFDARKRYKYN